MATSGLFAAITPTANGIPMAAGTGLIDQGWVFPVQAANTVFAGPASGADAAPGFRALAIADIPDLSSLYVPIGRLISTGTGLTGGGDLSADRTLAVDGNLATFRGLADASGWLHNDGTGVLAYSTPTPADIGLSAGNSITLVSGVIDTIQDIRTTATPQFARLGIGTAAALADYGILAVAPTTYNAALLAQGHGGIGGITLFPNQSGASANLISSDYLPGSSFLPLALSGRKVATDFALETNGTVSIGDPSTTDNHEIRVGKSGMQVVQYSGSYNGMLLTSNAYGAIQRDTSIPSWGVDIGGRNGLTGISTADQFTVARLAAGGLLWTELFHVDSSGNASLAGSISASALTLTGAIRFGSYNSGSVSQAGYITITDASGTTRRLLVG